MQRDAIERLQRWPRTRLANLPTPLLRPDRLAAELGVDDLVIKMDSETGFALGGNKVRKLEFVLAPDRVEGVTCLVTAGGPQSNHCRVTAAYAARRGLRCILVTQGPAPDQPTGNALLHRLFGAEIVTVADPADRIGTMQDVATAVDAEGGRAMVVPIGASTGLGSLGYALGALEMIEQLDALDPSPDATSVFVSSSSCGTLAGLLLGLTLLDRRDVQLVGISADATREELRSTTLEITEEGASILEVDVDLSAIELVTVDDQVGDGYGISTPASEAATKDFGRLAGIVLDPTYTAKAAAGMIDWIRRQKPASSHRIVFLHTGGHPGLLA